MDGARAENVGRAVAAAGVRLTDVSLHRPLVLLRGEPRRKLATADQNASGSSMNGKWPLRSKKTSWAPWISRAISAQRHSGIPATCAGNSAVQHVCPVSQSSLCASRPERIAAMQSSCCLQLPCPLLLDRDGRCCESIAGVGPDLRRAVCSDAIPPSPTTALTRLGSVEGR